jgi:hypothetical protein
MKQLEMLRYCNLCNEVVPANEYLAHRRRHRERKGSSSQWRKLRQQILARDGHRCTVCGATENLEVHHRDSNWKNNDPSNLVVRCLAHNPRGRPSAA